MPFRNASTTSPSSSILSSFSAILSPRICAPPPGGGGTRFVSSLRDRRDIRRLGALRALTGFELHLGALGQRLEAAAGDLRVMDEQVLAAVFRRDEPVALRIVEPLDDSGCHKKTPPSPNSRTGKEGRRHHQYSSSITLEV